MASLESGERINLGQDDFNIKKLELQRQTIETIKNSGLPFIIAGSWALKNNGVLKEDYTPNDIDVYVAENDLTKITEFCRRNNWKIEPVSGSNKLAILNGPVFIDLHIIDDKGSEYVEKTVIGVFHYPKAGFSNIDGLVTMKTELIFLLEKGSGDRPGKVDKLKELKAALNLKELKIIDKGFKFDSLEGI